jgi:hypothetical protein
MIGPEQAQAERRIYVCMNDYFNYPWCSEALADFLGDTRSCKQPLVLYEPASDLERLREAIRKHRDELDAAALHGAKRDRDQVDNDLYNTAFPGGEEPVDGE